jgi:ribonuclease HI
MIDNLFENATSSSGSGEWVVAHCDGGSRGNPGPAGYGAVIEDADGRTLAKLSEFLGIQTNNFAEYSALLAVLRWAAEHKVPRLRVISDSELMVKQMQGKYKVASPVLRPLWEEAKRMARGFEAFEMRHTLRGGNKTADRLANEAMDKGMGKGTAKPVIPPVGKPESFAATRMARQPAARVTQPILEGYVKGGVIHLLNGELPDGVFVKIICKE